jgi:hypothetical protein
MSRPRHGTRSGALLSASCGLLLPLMPLLMRLIAERL